MGKKFDPEAARVGLLTASKARRKSQEAAESAADPVGTARIQPDPAAGTVSPAKKAKKTNRDYYDQRISLKLTSEQYEQVQAFCKENGMTVNNFFRTAAIFYMKAHA